MTDEPNNPSPEEQEKTGPADPSPGPGAPLAPGAGAQSADAGTLPPPPDADQPRPTPESQAALTGKAPSGSSTSGTTVPADTGAVPPKPKAPPAAPPSNESPEEKKARLERIIAEAKAKKEAAAAAAAAAEGQGESVKEVPGGKSPAVGDPAKSPSQADLEKAAKIAEARARAAALKEASGAKTPAAAGEAKPAPAARPAAAAGAAAPGAPKAPVKKKDEGPKPEDASGHQLVKSLRGRAGDAAVTGAFNFLGQLSVHVSPDAIVQVCRLLRDDAETPFDYLSDLTCVHWPERDDAPFEVVYNLYSISKNVRVRLKVGVSEEVESVTSVWPAANWMEREVYDLFGVRFRGHPDLRRLLLPTDWDGHPLRKDYPLEFMENQWTTRHLPEFTNVQQEQLVQRRAYGLEILQTPDERRIREIFRDGRDPLPKEHK